MSLLLHSGIDGWFWRTKENAFKKTLLEFLCYLPQQWPFEIRRTDLRRLQNKACYFIDFSIFLLVFCYSNNFENWSKQWYNFKLDILIHVICLNFLEPRSFSLFLPRLPFSWFLFSFYATFERTYIFFLNLKTKKKKGSERILRKHYQCLILHSHFASETACLLSSAYLYRCVIEDHFVNAGFGISLRN